MAKDFFTENKVEFTDVDVTQDQEALKNMVEKTGQMGVPVIFFADEEGKEEFVVGFDQGRISQILGLGENTVSPATE